MQELFRGHAILWMTRWGFYSLGLDRGCPVRAVLCLDDSRTNDLIEERLNARVFSLDRGSGRRTHWPDSAGDSILAGARGELRALLQGRNGWRWWIASTNGSRSLEAFAAEAGLPYLGTAADLYDWLDNKPNFLNGLEKSGLPRLAGRWLRLAERRYTELAAEMGTRLVVQLPRGTSGSGTRFLASEDDYAAAGARFGDALVWAAPDLGDLSLNINAIATEDGTAVAYPSVQLTGLPELSTRRGQYCGNDYAATAAVPREAVGDVIEQTSRVGEWLAGLGFRGLFGLDFVLDPATGKAYAVDLNPRWQGSTLWLAQAQEGGGLPSLPTAELAWRMGLLETREVLRWRDRFLAPVSSTHMSVRNRVPGWLEVRGDVSPGAYTFAGRCAYARPALRMGDLQDQEEMLVIGGVPRSGARIGPGAQIVRLGGTKQVVDPAAMKLLPWARETVRLLEEALDLGPCPV